MGRVKDAKKAKKENIVDVVEDVLTITGDIHIFWAGCFNEFFVAFAGKGKKEQEALREKIRAVLHEATVGSEKST